MLSASVDPASSRFTRSDAGRLLAASAVLVLAMSVILGLDILPAQATLVVDKPAPGLDLARQHAEDLVLGQRDLLGLLDVVHRVLRHAQDIAAQRITRPHRCGRVCLESFA